MDPPPGLVHGDAVAVAACNPADDRIVEQAPYSAWLVLGTHTAERIVVVTAPRPHPAVNREGQSVQPADGYPGDGHPRQPLQHAGQLQAVLLVAVAKLLALAAAPREQEAGQR